MVNYWHHYMSTRSTLLERSQGVYSSKPAVCCWLHFAIIITMLVPPFLKIKLKHSSLSNYLSHTYSPLHPQSSGTPPELQAQQVQAQPQPQHQPQPGEAIELVTGSGVYILAYRLQEARREAKTGTQLARKLMDCFWDKETLAKSTLTPRSKFQYQQLDPKIIKAIEGMPH